MLNDDRDALDRRCAAAESKLERQTRTNLRLSRRVEEMEADHRRAQDELATLRSEWLVMQQQCRQADDAIGERDALRIENNSLANDLVEAQQKEIVANRENANLKTMALLVQENQVETDESNQCVICLSAAATHVAVPCGHMAFCASCRGQQNICAVCRAPVQRIIRVFKA